MLPVGEIQYQGRTLSFTPAYLRGLAEAFRSRAYDQVSFQLADSANSHTNDPERHRGTVVDMQAEPDGLWITVDPTPRGEAVLRENPYLGVSARIVEQFQRGDGAFYPAAVQHVLGTLDPRIPALGSWQPVDMANESSVTIDLSNLSFAGQPAPAYADDQLTDAELDQLIDVLAEVEDSYDAPEAQMPYDDRASAFSEFDQAFTARQAADQAREDARAAALVEDVMHPARRDEDRMARLLRRAADGVYSGQQADFTADEAAVELAVATGHGPCGITDSYGRCAERYHQIGCLHDVSTDWAASGPHPGTGVNALSNFADSLELTAPGSYYGDPDDDDQPWRPVPQRTVELAARAGAAMGLFDDHWPTAPAADLMRMPAAPVSAYQAMYDEVSFDDPAPQPQMSYPGIRQLAIDLGLR